MAEAAVAAQPFPSLAALRAAEAVLLAQLEGLDETKPPESLLADVEVFRQRAAATGKLLSVPDDRSEAQSILNFWLTVLYRAREKPATVLLAPFDQQAARERAAEAIPYKGLEPFQIDDQVRFFGRRRALTALLDKLRAGRLVALTGLSGSGKSSLIRAGLIPALRDGAVHGSEGWCFPEPIVPGSTPLSALAKLTPDPPPEANFLEDPRTLAAALDRLGAPAFITIDQFEELFTLSPDGPGRTAFVENLLHAISGGAYPHAAVVTMRSEYDDYVERYPQLAPLFSTGRVNLGALTAPDLRLAIEQPAAQLGVSFEAGLIEELVQRVLGEPAGLPLLQFTLLSLWNKREDNAITWAAYRALGGSPREILARQASEVYESFHLDQDRILTRRVFQSLVQLGAGLEATARRVRRGELDRCGARDNVDRVLGIWRDAGLLRVSPPGPIAPDTQVEVAHEALIRNWKELVQWVEEEFAESRRRSLLRQKALDWRQGKEPLLPELSLQEAESYYDLEPLEREYVTASREAINRANGRIRRVRNQQIVFGLTASMIGIALLVYGIRETRRAGELDQQRLVVEGQLDRVNRQRMETEGRLRAANLELDEARSRLSQVNENTLREIQHLNELKEQIVGLQRQKAELADRATKLTDSLDAEKQRSSAALQTLKTVNALRDSERPAIPLVDGSLGPIPVSWKRLEGARRQVEATARSVGRVETASRSDFPYLGSAFVIAPGIVVTHDFIVSAARKDVSQLRFDFHDRPSASTGKFTGLEIVGTVRNGKLVFIRVSQRNDQGEALPPPLKVETVEAGTLSTGRPLYVVGYPSHDPRMDRRLTQTLLGDLEGVKRVQPGFLLNWTASGPSIDLMYDCTTSGGNGGSPAIDLETGRVLGIHWGGSAETGKFATAFTRSLVQEASRSLGIDLGN